MSILDYLSPVVETNYSAESKPACVIVATLSETQPTFTVEFSKFAEGFRIV